MNSYSGIEGGTMLTIAPGRNDTRYYRVRLLSLSILHYECIGVNGSGSLVGSESV